MMRPCQTRTDRIRADFRLGPKLAALAATVLGLAGLVAAQGRPVAADPTQTGAYVLAATWQSSAGDLPADAWRYATGIDITPAGRIFIADRDEARLTVIELDDSVHFLQPSPGYDDQLVAPGHLAADAAAGRLYVADPAANAVAVFGLDGARMATWPNIPEAAGVAVTPDGNVLVGSAKSGEVYVYSPEGFRIATWQVVPPDPAGGLIGGIDVDASGRIYVVDGRELQIHVLGADGRPTDKIRVDLPDSTEIRDIAVDDGAAGPRASRYFVATTAGGFWQDARAGGLWRPLPTGASFGIALDVGHGIVATSPGRPGLGSRITRMPYAQGTTITFDKLWGSSLLLPGTLDGPEVISAGADGGLYLLDRGNRVQRFSPDGRSVEQRDQVLNPTRVDAGADGTIYISDGASVTAFTRGPSGWNRGWNLPVAPPGRDDSQAAGLVYSPAADTVVVLDSEQDRLRRFTPGGQRGADTALRPAADDSTVWVDLAVDRTGNLYALDRSNRSVHIIAPDGSQRITSLPAPARHLAVGPGGELFAMDRDGWVRRYDVAGAAAQRTAAFDVTRFDIGLTTGPSDLAVDGSGDVLVTDRDANVVSRYTWDPSATPQDPPEAAGAQCRSFPGKTASPAFPTPVTVGADVDVRLTVRGGCGSAASNAPRDIVLILDISGSMAGEKIRILREAALNFVGEVDFASSRAGVVSFDDTARIEQGLTSNANLLRTAIRRLDYDPNGGTAIHEGLREAREHWSGRRRPEARPVFILMSDGGSNLGLARSEADLAKRDGVEIFTIGIQASRMVLLTVATDPSHFFEADSARFLFGIFERIADRVTVSTLFRAITITDQIPANMRLVPGSVVPAAAFDPQTNTLVWALADIPFNGFALRYQLQPQAAGDWPTNIAAWGDFTDGFGVAGRLDFPIPRVRVVAAPPSITPTPAPSDTPTASPTVPPTATLTPTVTQTPTATPTITPSPRPTLPPKPVYIPIALKEKPCVPTERHADVVLVIDTSSSMTGEKLAAAKTAAQRFVGLLNLGADQAAVVGFNTQATLASPLSVDRSALGAAIGGLTTAPGTRIDRGLEAALGELDGPRHRLTSTPVIVLLTDGRQDEGVAHAIDLATAARGAGKVIFAIGLGSDVDLPFLDALAGGARTFLAPGPADLGRIYAQIAGEVPCPPEVYWGRRR